MKAKDVMTRPVVSVSPDTGVREIARTLLGRRISAVPVLDGGGRIVGIVSEGDLMRRPESHTESRGLRSWWLEVLEESEDRARRYLKSHGLTAAEVMTRTVITVGENTSLAEIATLLERNHIKRVPVLRAGKLVGIVSRANLLQGLAAGRGGAPKAAAPDAARIRDAVLAELRDIGLRSDAMNVVVEAAVVHLWGWVESDAERKAAALAARRTPGVRQVKNHLAILTARMIGAIGTE